MPVGHDGQQGAGIALAGQQGDPVLLFGAVADVVGDAGGNLETGRHDSVNARAQRGWRAEAVYQRTLRAKTGIAGHSAAWRARAVAVVQSGRAADAPCGAASIATLAPLPPASSMDSDDIKRRLIELQIEHRDLDEAIDRLALQAGVDELQLRRLKKRKLQIKDTIVQLEMLLVPDIPA